MTDVEEEMLKATIENLLKAREGDQRGMKIMSDALLQMNQRLARLERAVAVNDKPVSRIIRAMN